MAARDPGYQGSIERMRRALETDRFGLVAQVLASRGCTADNCPAFGLLRDPARVIANLNERAFDANVVLHAANWRPDAAAAVVSMPPPGPAVAAVTPAPGPVAVPLSSKYDFPSAASIPPVSIMNAEPPLPPANEQAAAPAAPAKPAAAPQPAPQPRRQTAREREVAPTPVPAAPPAPAAPAQPPSPGNSSSLR
jgi:hypothetical protein